MKLDGSQTKSVDELGNSAPLPGKYHALVKSALEGYSKAGKPQVVVEFEVLGGTIPGQEGRTLTEFFSADPTNSHSLDRLKRLAMSIGIMRPGETRDVDFGAEAPGRQLIIEVETSTFDGKTRNRVGFAGLWPLDHGGVKDVPRNAQMLAVLRAGPAAQAPAGAPAAAPEVPGGGWGSL